MKKIYTVLALCWAASAALAVVPQPDLLARIHFAGGDTIAADKNYAPFATQFSSPEALALRKQSADRLASWLAHYLNPGAPAGGSQVRPLLEDLQHQEWYLEAREGNDGKAEWALAIRLSAAQQSAWQTALQPLLPAATFQSANGWLVLESGTGSIKCAPAVLKWLATPAKGWADINLNWPRLAAWFPAIKELGITQSDLHVEPVGGNLQVNGELYLANAMTKPLPAWQFPTTLVHQPLGSLTAVRGIAAWLNSQPWVHQYGIPTADQGFIWSLNAPFQNYVALPVPAGPAALTTMGQATKTALHEDFLNHRFMLDMESELNQTNGTISFKNVPFAAPSVRSVMSGGTQYLLAGGFPSALKAPAIPAESLQWENRPDLLYYHQENTRDIFANVLQLNQLYFVVSMRRQLNGNGLAFKWAEKVAAAGTSNITMVDLVGANQAKFSRTAPVGLTAYELFLLATWLDDVHFPQFNLNIPSPAERLKARQGRAQQPPNGGTPPAH